MSIGVGVQAAPITKGVDRSEKARCTVGGWESAPARRKRGGGNYGGGFGGPKLDATTFKPAPEAHLPYRDQALEVPTMKYSIVARSTIRSLISFAHFPNSFVITQ